MPMALDPNPAPSTSLLKRCCARIGFGKKDGYVPEDFNYSYSPTDALHTLEGLNDTGNINDYMTNTRPANCYMSSESDYQLVLNGCLQIPVALLISAFHTTSAMRIS